MGSLAKSAPPPGGDAEQLRARIAELEGALHHRAGEVRRVRASLDAFKIRYRRDVGLLHEQLDELERAIAEAENGIAGADTAAAGANRTADPADGPPPAAPRYTSDAVRKLFRDVAKAVHPDLARDALARDRRHRLMIEANQAYAIGDEERLRWILHAWENSPDAVVGHEPDALRLRFERRVAELEQQLRACEDEVTALQASPLWKLKTMVDEAAGRGKDLVRDMVGRLKRDIMVAQNRLDAIRSR